MSALLLVVAVFAASPDAGGLHRPGITMKEARTIALGRVPGGKVRSEELEKEKGRLVYSFDVVIPGKSGVEELLIDAQTGAVVSQKHETPEDEARERQADKKKADAG